MVTDPFVRPFRFISFDLDIFDPSSPPRSWCRRLPCSSPPTPIVFPPLLTHRMAWCVRVYEQGVGFAYESSAKRQINKVHMATHSVLLGLVVDLWQPHNHCKRLEYSKQDSNCEWGRLTKKRHRERCHIRLERTGEKEMNSETKSLSLCAPSATIIIRQERWHNECKLQWNTLKQSIYPTHCICRPDTHTHNNDKQTIVVV